MTELDNSSAGLMKFLDTALSELDSTPLEKDDISKVVQAYPILKNIVEEPSNLAVKYFLTYNDDDKIKELHKEHKLKENIVKVVNAIRTYGDVLVVYNDKTDVEKAPSKNFENFLTFPDYTKTWDDEKKEFIFEVSVLQDNSEEKKIIHQQRVLYFNETSVIQDTHKVAKALDASIMIPVRLMKRSQSDIFKMPNLAQSLASCKTDVECQEQYKRLFAKIKTAYDMMNNFSILPIDIEEEFTQVTKSLDSYEKTQSVLMIYLSALTNIPSTVLFGKSPSGFNSGEHETLNYYDFIASTIQEKLISKIIDFYHGILKINFNITYAPLKQLTRLEMIEVEKVESEVIAARVSAITALLVALDDTPTDNSLLDFVFNGKPLEKSDLQNYRGLVGD